MKISMRQTGGYAGLDSTKTVDTNQLNSEAGASLRSLVEKSNLFNRVAGAERSFAGADLVHYEITVSEGEREHTVAFDDDGSDELVDLRQLAHMVIRNAQ